MPYRKTTFLPRNCYHIYNRGNHREAVFVERDNYNYFLRLFQKHFPSDHISILAYCLMPNHYHFLIELLDDYDVSSKMKNLIIAYTKAFNQRYHTVGHLFQGRFKSKPVDSEEYLLTLTRYIHNNPAKALLVRSNEQWEFSSYAEYLGVKTNPIANTERTLKHFCTIDDFKKFSEGMQLKEFRRMRKDLYPDPPAW